MLPSSASVVVLVLRNVIGVSVNPLAPAFLTAQGGRKPSYLLVEKSIVVWVARECPIEEERDPIQWSVSSPRSDSVVPSKERIFSVP